jgi:[FeFe] hydrogenase H-cluster maturation GTPase HydF
MTIGRKTPKGMRLHIGLFGRRNSGKSSLLNAFTRQNVSIVSEVAGTTTDPVEKPMELLPLGPVLFIDTAGIDDEGALGQMRVDKTRRVLDRADLAVLVCEADSWSPFEQGLREELASRGVPTVVALSKTDIHEPLESTLEMLARDKVPFVLTSSTKGLGIEDLRQALLDAAPEGHFAAPAIASDIVGPKEVALLVTPIDKEAPRGRLILPQVQTLRDLLDGDAINVVVKESELPDALDLLKKPPRLVVTDSQAFETVCAAVPSTTMVTGFSVLYARLKGDLPSMVASLHRIDELVPGDKVLIAESCSHHPIGEDIGRIKIPRWLSQHVGGPLEVSHVQGQDFPEDLSPYRLVIHCGACMFNRKAMLSRQHRAARQGVPLTNYGLVIAYTLGILERALEPFPSALEAFHRKEPQS